MAQGFRTAVQSGSIHGQLFAGDALWVKGYETLVLGITPQNGGDSRRPGNRITATSSDKYVKERITRQVRAALTHDGITEVIGVEAQARLAFRVTV